MELHLKVEESQMATTELIELAIETSKQAYTLFSLSHLELF